MGSYYFTVASLPLLFYDKTPPITLDYFLQTCETHLQKNDFKMLLNAKLASITRVKPCSSTYERFQEWEKSLRNTLAKLRAGKKGVDAKPYLKETKEVLAVEKIARQAIEETSPLKAEHILNRARWHYLEELELMHFFDIEKLVVFYLQLQVLERKALFNFDTGKQSFESINKNISEKIRSGVKLYE